MSNEAEAAGNVSAKESRNSSEYAKTSERSENRSDMICQKSEERKLRPVTMRLTRKTASEEKAHQEATLAWDWARLMASDSTVRRIRMERPTGGSCLDSVKMV
jgi:hypothetical protein